VTEYFEECKRGTEPWNQMPRRMLRNKAIIQAIRVAFGVGGILDEDEASDVSVRNVTPVKVVTALAIDPFEEMGSMGVTGVMEEQEEVLL
jgi:hypothetical protein